MRDDYPDMMTPEQALTRFDKPDISLLGISDSLDEYKQYRYGFRVETFGFLVSPGTSCEVMKNFTVYPIPNTRTWLQGLVNLRGNLIPVYDFSLLLGLSNEPMIHESLLIIDSGQQSAGLLIDGLPLPCDTSRWPALPSSPKLPAVLSESVGQAFSIDEVLWLEFDHRAFLRDATAKVAL